MSRHIRTVGHVVEANTGSKEYLDAATRKMQIGRYHVGELRALLEARPSYASVAVQAHFEGVLYAFVAASDQLAEAINLQFALGLEQANLYDALERMPNSAIRRRLFRWHNSAIAADVRSIRRQAVHHHYKKTPQGPRLEVQPPRGKPYGGSRTLGEYATSAVSHLERLGPLVEQLRDNTSPTMVTPEAGTGG